MRLPSARFTLRGMMVAVAVVAILIWGELARRRWNRPIPKAVNQVNAVAAEAFGPDHWAAQSASCRFYDAGRGYWIFSPHPMKTDPGGQIVIQQFAIVWRSPDGKGLKSATGDLAHFDFTRSLDGNDVGPCHARFQGSVRLRDNLATQPRADDVARGPLAIVDYDELSIENVGRNLMTGGGKGDGGKGDGGN